MQSLLTHRFTFAARSNVSITFCDRQAMRFVKTTFHRVNQRAVRVHKTGGARIDIQCLYEKECTRTHCSPLKVLNIRNMYGVKYLSCRRVYTYANCWFSGTHF